MRSDGHVGAAADAGHGAEKPLEARGIGVERGKGFIATGGFALPLAGAQGGGELAPVMKQALVGHLEDAADVGRFVLVEKEIG